MKIFNLDDERVHVLDAHSDVWSVIRDIVDVGNQEDAFYVCDIGDIVRQHRLWKAVLPRVQPFYAVKCNDSLTVLEVLAALGTGFDCASKVEINKILSLGVDASRIVYANPAKPSSHIRYAASVGVDLMTFDNELELYKTKDLFPTARMLIRIRCDDTSAQCQLGIKFGCDPIAEAPNLLRLAQTLGINVVGVSFHVGSGCKNPPVFRKAIKAAREIFDFAASLGFNLNILDIGGGYPGGRDTNLVKIAEVVNVALDDFFPDPEVSVIAEPGRFYVSSAYTLACNVYSIRALPTENSKKPHFMYYINDGVYGSFNCVLYDHQEVVAQPLKDYPCSKLYSSSVWGPTCDGLDQVIENTLLPQLHLGDWLIFDNMGAYTLPVASPFNGFPIPKVHVVADENSWLLLKDAFPLSEDHFAIGNIPNNLKCMNINNEDWKIPNFPITISLCNNSSVNEDHILDFVDLGPMD